VADTSEAVVRRAFAKFAQGDFDGLVDLVAQDFEWTYFDPSLEEPEPQTCHGREQLGQWGRRAVGMELEELLPVGEAVVVVSRHEGLDATRAWKTGDRNFHVVTVRAGRITSLRACRDRAEALKVARAAGP